MKLREFQETPMSELVSPELEPHCAICNQRITGESEHEIDSNPVHEDCYFNALGEIVENQPPRAGR